MRRDDKAEDEVEDDDRTRAPSSQTAPRPGGGVGDAPHGSDGIRDLRLLVVKVGQEGRRYLLIVAELGIAHGGDIGRSGGARHRDALRGANAISPNWDGVKA